MKTEKFRRQLRDETAQWHQEGLIDHDLYQILTERYQFNSLESSSNRHFITILWGLGGILLGLGAITFVAANWQDWSRPLRVVLLFGIFAAVNLIGFSLWRRPQPREHRLGHGLLLTGALLLGANLGLMSQMFHQSGPLSDLFFVWALGVLAMAYGLRLVSLGILSWILLFLGYWIWLGGAGGLALSTWSQLFVAYLPVMVSVFYLPFAHWFRSSTIYGLWGIGVALMFAFPNPTLLGSYVNAWTLPLILSLPPALLWVYHSHYWHKLLNRILHRHPSGPSLAIPGPRRVTDPFQGIGQSLAVWFVSLLTYAFSFQGLWMNNTLIPEGSGPFSVWGFVFTCLPYIVMVAYGWYQLYRHRRFPKVPQALWMTSSVFAGGLVLIWGLLLLYMQGEQFAVVGLVLMNGILFFMALAMLHDGLLMGIRRRFWGGMGLLVMGLISRMFEYNTGLILKAIVLSLCGLAIIAAGLLFERRQTAQALAAQSESGS